MIIQFMIRGGVGANVVLGEGKARGGHDWESGASGGSDFPSQLGFLR